MGVLGGEVPKSNKQPRAPRGSAQDFDSIKPSQNAYLCRVRQYVWNVRRIPGVDDSLA